MTDTYTKIEFYEKDNDRNKSLPKMSKKFTPRRPPQTLAAYLLHFFFFAPGFEPVTTRPNVNQYLQHHVKRTNRNSA